ncbi:MAG: TerD family protein [Myxococcota bacterium]
MDLKQANARFLRRRLRLILDPGQRTLDAPYVATFLKNLEGLGFTASPTLIERLGTLEPEAIGALLANVLPVLRELVGAHVNWTPMYPGFPAQVMEASDATLYLNALRHYLANERGLRWLPDLPDPERPPLPNELATRNLRVIELGSREELREVGRKLMAANGSLSETDKEDVRWFVSAHAGNLEQVLPGALPNKENLAVVAGVVLQEVPAMQGWVARQLGTATDVLRVAVALSDGDVSLASPTRFGRFRRPMRRQLLGLIEGLRQPLEDLFRHRGPWIRLGERLHPGEYARAFPKTAEAFRRLRNGDKPETFAAHVELELEADDVQAAVSRLMARPGEFARRLDQLLRRAAEPTTVLDAFGLVAKDVSSPVLLQLDAHFQHRSARRERRSFFPKGQVGLVVTIPDTLPALPESVTEAVQAVVRRTLRSRFAGFGPLGRCYLDEALRTHLVPFSQRSASKALRTLVRGSSLPLPEGDTVRFFLWWREGEVDGQPTGPVDIDLSSVLYDEDWGYKEHISYTNLRSSKYRAAHSGDVTSAPSGACEFIDIDIASVVRFGGRYVVMSVFAYSGHRLKDLPECFAGWMMRTEPNSGEIFEPATVVDRIDLASDQRINVPVILDLVERRAYWTDVGLSSNPRWSISVEGNDRGMTQIGRAMTTLVKLTLYDLFALHIEARGMRVDSPEEADVIFSVHQGITPFEPEVILADYL